VFRHDAVNRGISGHETALHTVRVKNYDAEAVMR